MDKILYIEAIDINALYGSGGGPMFRYSNKVSRQFIYITFTSTQEKLGVLHVKQIDNLNFKYIPICRTISNKYIKSIVPLNLYFILNLLFRYKTICQLKTKKIITKTNTVLWFFNLIKKGYDVCYVFPGLENALLIGRFPRLGRLLLPFFDSINNPSLKRTSAIFAAASDDSLNKKNCQLRSVGEDNRIIKIPQAVDNALFENKDKEQCKKEINVSERYVFTFLGRLAAVKGIDYLIETFQMFNKRYPDSKFIIIGEGEESHELSRIIFDRDLSDKVLMVGRKSPPELINYMCASDAGIFASHAEGFSNAMLEFLSCGIPIISTKVGGVDELIIENCTGYVILDRNREHFLAAMEDIIKNDFKDNCIKHVDDNFTLNKQWKIIADNWKPFVLYTDLSHD